MQQPEQQASPSPDSSRPKIQVIARAAGILRVLENHPEGLSLGGIATRVGLARSTVQRIVAALAEEQILIAATPRSRVKLGPALIRLAKAANTDISQQIRPYLETLCRDLRETIDLAIMQGHYAVFIDQLPGTQRLRAVSAVGERFPLYCTASGKSLLAALPPRKLDRYLTSSLKSLTSCTVTDPTMLREQIKQITQKELADDLEEHTEGICAVSTWFKDPVGRVYAISIPAPTARFHKHRKQFETALLASRDQIISLLGNVVSI